MNPETLRKIFKSPFDYKTYSNEIVHRLFGNNDVATTPELLDTNAEGDKSYFIGQMEDADGRLLGFFYTRVADGGDVRRKRVGLRKLIQPYLKYDVDGAIAVFDDGNHWRLSYICDLKEGNTAAKRFSYILGDEQGQYKTPIERLGKVAEKNGRFKLSDLREAFSVDALSKEFFDEYHRHYDIIINELKRQGFEGATIHDYVKKMMGRIVFLHFLQKKGWLNGNLAFLRDLFFFSPHQGDFLEQVLEPLFFGIFNTEKANRELLFKAKGWDMGLLEDWKELPYLNGGLFERDAVDEQNITLPALLFEDLFTVMASYNFTVDENDPDDAEVGVDPEMLGKIFESLLEDNKAKGAFYTPKEIVRYMCKESLIAYLVSQIGKSQSVAGPASLMSERKENSDNSFHSDCNKANSDCDKQIRSFVERHEFPSELEPYRDTLDAALRNVKICDPAIGSGAFPMGLLNELWRCREALAIREANNLQDLQDFVSAASRSNLKKEIIENNIYGVDIEKGAIDIARLRFWLSIVVDAEEPEPLPNFDYKFMQGNSLIESYKGIDLSRISNRLRGGQSKSTQLLLGLDSDFSKKNLQRLMRDYFSVTDHKQKASMRQAINDEVKRLITDFIGGTAADLDKLDPSANQDFFLWHTWFKDIFDNGGFDIVIGNPPYINIANLTDDYARMFYQRNYKTVKNKCDLYSIFTERAHGLLKMRGICSFIFSNSWLGTDSFSLFRKFLVNETKVIKLIDLPDKVFVNATVKTCIILFSKAKTNNHTIILENYDGIVFCEMDHSLTYKSIMQYDNYPFSFEHGIDMSKVEVVALGDIAEFSLGIKTSNDKKFISNSPFPEDSYRLIRGRNIQRYNTPLSQEWIWYRPDLFMEKVGAGPRKLENFLVKKKILIQDIAQEICATIDSNMYLCNDTINLIFAIDDKFKFEYVLGLLNSKPVRFWHKKIFPEGLHIKIYQLKEIPIPVVSFERQDTVVELVNQILLKKKSNPNADTSSLEYEIDKLVYQLYNLTPEEIAVIEQ
ncbi:MAG: N-6 DNA methylase [Bacteroidales bacterium]|nr:N-6 DNA methylase [Bacteroidales bacterium]